MGVAKCKNMDSRIKTPKVERVLLHQHHRSREYITGTLCMTDRHFIFIEPTGLKETWVLYHHILSVNRQSLTTKGYPLIIDTKTFQQLCLIIPRESDCIGIMDTISLFAQPDKYDSLYAFQYKPNIEGYLRSRGWNLYDSVIEFNRMGLPNEHWTFTDLNKNYELCPTYSSTLCVPQGVDNDVILGCAKFRSKGRLPVLSYYHEVKNSALCRCSQPLSYITRRSVDDEAMIQSIVDSNPHASFLYLLDTRPKLNAMANKAAHKGGYENTDNYPNIRYQFTNIQNIHVMRESLQKLMEAVHNTSGGVGSLLSGLESSSWLKHIHLILDTALFIAKAIYCEGVNVLVHCSDGWDRTAQTCALASLLMDPYYRTIHGFMVLIEKEWLSFGHKFTVRCGHLNGDLKETSPIFTQFLDAVWQVMVQYPLAFQFNELFLITIHDHLYSSQFGTFLGNNECERKKLGLNESTYSLWGFIWNHLENYTNPLYQSDAPQSFIEPEIEIPLLKIWLGLYCRHEVGPHPHELVDEAACSTFQQNKCLEEHKKFLEQHKIELEERLKEYCDFNNIRKSPTEFVTDSEKHGSDEVSRNKKFGKTDRESCDTYSDTITISGDEAIKNGESGQHSEHALSDSDSEDIPTREKGTPNSQPSPEELSQKHPGSVMLQSLIFHIPEMNLPWHPMRTVTQCACGTAFAFTQRKYHCSYCGTVICSNCGGQHTSLPYLSNPSTHRVCKTCFKLMQTRQQVT